MPQVVSFFKRNEKEFTTMEYGRKFFMFANFQIA